MKKYIRTVLTVFLILTCISNLKAFAQDEYGWVLIQIVDNDCKEEIDQYNDKSYRTDGVYEYRGIYSSGNFAIEQKYVGKTDTYYDPDRIHGEKNLIKAVWSKPPQVIKAGETLTMTLSLSSSPDTSYFDFGGYASAKIGSTYLKNPDGKYEFKSTKSNNYQTCSEELSVSPGTGSVGGKKLELSVKLNQGFTMSTVYIYEWKKLDEDAYKQLETDDKIVYAIPEMRENTEEPTKTSEAKPRETWVVPKTEDGKYKDSGVRVSDIWGEVQIRRGDDRLGWDILYPDDVIYVGDVIRTKREGGVVLSLADMTTFEMKPESELIMNTESEKENKLIFLAGKVWTNVKKMVKDGSLDVEMGQACMGIKGTTFVLEEDGVTSTLKVLEGTVSFKPNNGEELIITDGQMVSAIDGVAGEIAYFSIDDELSEWREETQDTFRAITKESELKSEQEYENYDDLSEEQENNTDIIIVTVVIAALLITGIIIAIFIIKRKKQ